MAVAPVGSPIGGAEAAPVPAEQAAGAALTQDSVSITGHGYGHDLGMSQYGAFGYAVDHEVVVG
ncbi:MAG: hypothetical protein R2715_24145 [Ilumatobacteraceae bacterium]